MIDGIRYVRAVRRHARLVVATALVAVVLTILMLFFLPQRYRATADVVVILPDVQTGSLIATTAQAVSDFEGALRTAAVARAAAEDSGLSASSISDGLRTEWLEGGTVVEVTFIGPDPGSTEAAVFTASKEAIGLLLDARLAPITHRLENAQRAMAAANQALDDLTIEHELLNVDDYLDSQQDRVRELQSDRDQALVDGDEERAQEIQDRITSLLQETAAIRTEFNTAQTTREQAAASLAEARTAHETALGAVEAAEDASTIKVLSAEPVPRTERLPSQLLVVVVIATALTIGLIVLLELLTPRQRVPAASSDRRDRAPAGPSPAATERRRPGPAPPVPMRTPSGSEATRGVAGGRTPTAAGSSSPSASRAAPAVDASIQERRSVPPSPARTSSPTDGPARRPPEVREESAVGPRPSRPDRPVMGGAGAAPPTVAPPPQPVRSAAPEQPRRGSVEPRDRRTSPGDAATSSSRPADGNDRTDVTTDRASTGDQGATAPERPGNANRSSKNKNKKRKNRNRQPSGPGAAPASPASATTPPSSASRGDDRSAGAGEVQAEPVSAPPAGEGSATATSGEGTTPAAAAPAGGEQGPGASADRTDEPTTASTDGGSNSDARSAQRSQEPGPSRNG